MGDPDIDKAILEACKKAIKKDAMGRLIHTIKNMDHTPVSYKPTYGYTELENRAFDSLKRAMFLLLEVPNGILPNEWYGRREKWLSEWDDEKEKLEKRLRDEGLKANLAIANSEEEAKLAREVKEAFSNE
jgi:hypothetical protein